MPPNGLSDDRIRVLFQRFLEAAPWPEWRKNFLGELQYFEKVSEDELRTPSNQERLWRARGISGIGPGEAVNTKGAYADEKVVSAVIAIRHRTWATDVEHRAKELQDEFERVLALVYPAHSPQRPHAKLGRLFTALVPAHMHTCYSWKSYQGIARLVLGHPGFAMCDGAVRIRERLRGALGPEKALEDHVERSMYCWWLHENAAPVEAGKDPEPVTGDPPGGEETKPIVLWPATKQIRGLTSIQGYVDGYRAVVNAAVGGATPEDIVTTMRSDLGFTDYAEKSCRLVFNRVRRLEFLEHKDGLWYPSEDGRRFVEEDPPEVLVERFLVQTFGLAHLLRFLNDGGPLGRRELFAKLRELYPNWSTDFAPSAIAGWAGSLGLAETDPQGRLVLTDYGRVWLKRLPEDLPVPPSSPIAAEGQGGVEPEAPLSAAFVAPHIEHVVAAFKEDEGLREFVFDEDDVVSLHLAWHSQKRKRFVILSGLSGTGKTALLLHYARVYCGLRNVDVNKHVSVVAVSPDWRDPTGLLGYFNALHTDPTFQAEPALRLVLEAAQNPSEPYFLILDEMNLARVEKYFAPFLSAMETGGQIALHAEASAVNGVPPGITWPTNLFIGGTVNMDETTHAFSDKVLDRAFTLEFWKVDLEAFFDRRQTSVYSSRRPEIEKLLLELNAALFRIRRHFGYRTAGEIMDYIDCGTECGVISGPTPWQHLDHAVFSKVLPRFRGEETQVLREVLENTRALCQERGMSRCEAKLAQMLDQLRSTGLTRFWA